MVRLKFCHNWIAQFGCMHSKFELYSKLWLRSVIDLDMTICFFLVCHHRGWLLDNWSGSEFNYHLL